MEDGIVDLIGMAAFLNVSVDTVRRKANAGQIPGVKVGNLWRFKPSEVWAALGVKSDPWARSAGAKARRAA